MAPFNGWGSTVLRWQSHCEEAVYYLPLRSQKFLVLTWLTSEGGKAESNLDPPSSFEHATSGLGIQCLKLEKEDWKKSLTQYLLLRFFFFFFLLIGWYHQNIAIHICWVALLFYQNLQNKTFSLGFRKR